MQMASGCWKKKNAFIPKKVCKWPQLKQSEEKTDSDFIPQKVCKWFQVVGRINDFYTSKSMQMASGSQEEKMTFIPQKVCKWL